MVLVITIIVMKKTNIPLIVNMGLVLLAAFTRLVPHPWNFTAISAMALFSGNKNKKLLPGILLPWIALFLTDLFIGFHVTMIYVYGAVALTVMMSRWLQMNRIRHYVLSALLSSVIFFVITNFGVWLSTGFYTRNLNGLIECFAMAVPFFKNQVLGDLFYTVALFSSSSVVVKSFEGIVNPSMSKSN